jgi:membrane protein implicated in regulation of membrane protease activity
MNWESFYLVCFFFGLALSVVSLLSGVMHLHLPARWHLPHGFHGMHGTQGAGMHGGGLHAQHAPHMPKGGGAEIPFFNFSGLTVFVCWFGGMGYLLTHYYKVWFVMGFAVSVVTGVLGMALVFWFIAKVLLRHDVPLDERDFEMVGVVGRLVTSIRENGTGELVYLQAGTRRVTGARSENGCAIERGSEVVVTRFEKGLAYVRAWQEFAEEHGVTAEGDSRQDL